MQEHLPQAKLGPHVADHLEVLGNELELLGHILTDALEFTTAVRTGARSRMLDVLARQMLGQRATRRFVAAGIIAIVGRSVRRLLGGQARLEFLDNELELRHMYIMLLGFAAKLQAAGSAQSAA